jgi:uncharacterized protein YciI
MRYFAAIRERGPSWDHARAMPEQDRWVEHAAFMNVLAAEGFVVLGGPLSDGAKILLIIDADSEKEIERRLAEDPWTPMGLLPLVSIEPWQIMLGD